MRIAHRAHRRRIDAYGDGAGIYASQLGEAQRP
jgi:hypothetical protein